jgi:thiamine-monophosphate kinase
MTEAAYDSCLPIAEKQLISRIRRLTAQSAARSKRLIAGIGDDAAVLRVPPEHDTLVTTDFCLEDVHFRREWDSPQSVGHRCLTRGLSDIAAMGGDPIAVFLSLALPPKIRQLWVDRFFDGLFKLAKQLGVQLAGGDTAQSPNRILADIIVLGSVPQGKAVLRSTARPGDRIYVTGKLGAAAAELAQLYSSIGKKPPRGKQRRTATLLPHPRVDIGRILRERGITSAMIDISDGLSTDLAHICQESGVGAEVWANCLPRATFRGGSVDLKFALHGGDAYELLFTARPRTRVPSAIGGVEITEIGEIAYGENILLRVAGQKPRTLKPEGWEHFRQGSSPK